MDSLRAEISDEIKAFIKSGFFNMDETFESIQDMFYEETLDEDWIKQEIAIQYNQRLAEQNKWDKRQILTAWLKSLMISIRPE